MGVLRSWASIRAVLNGGKKKKKKCSGTSFPKKARGHSMCSTMVGGGWQLVVGGGWRLAVGNWRLVAVGGGWRRLVVGDWWSVAVGSGWQLVAAGGWRRLVAGGWWRLVVGGWWRLAVDGSWRLAVGGPLGRSLRAVLSKKKGKKSGPLRTALASIILGVQSYRPQGNLLGVCLGTCTTTPFQDQKSRNAHSPKGHLQFKPLGVGLFLQEPSVILLTVEHHKIATVAS